jgi:hypothetical protein
MLEIGLNGLALALTAVMIAALKRGGKQFPSALALVVGVVLAYTYAHVGQPWSILSVKAHDMTARFGDHFGAAPAAVALAIGGWWHYTRPGPKGSVIQGFLMTNAALAATGLMTQATEMVGSLVQVVAG